MYKKFENPSITAKGEQRASVKLTQLDTLWFNTGTQCNLSCVNCYIESSPTNNSLVYITIDDVKPYLDEIKNDNLGTKKISFTGGEPFINPHMIDILELCLGNDHEVLVLTNAFNILKRHQEKLLKLKKRYPNRLKLRISLDHYTQKMHERERGVGTFDKTLLQMKWLYDHDFDISIAGRALLGEETKVALAGYQSLLDHYEIGLSLKDSEKIVVFPEMDKIPDVPEITIDCWDILNKTPDMIMCSSERMVVKRKGEESTKVLACTLLAYDKQFELGENLKESKKNVKLNHPWCAQFCVLGAASCSGTN